MVELACAGEPRFVPSRLEEGREKSYSIHTIERVKAQPDAGEVFFVIGSDAFAEIRSWYRWEDVVRETEFIIVARPGHTYLIPPGARVHRLETVALPVSSSETRLALARAGNRLRNCLPRSRSTFGSTGCIARFLRGACTQRAASALSKTSTEATLVGPTNSRLFDRRQNAA